MGVQAPSACAWNSIHVSGGCTCKLLPQMELYTYVPVIQVLYRPYPPPLHWGGWGINIERLGIAILGQNAFGKKYNAEEELSWATH